jgi:GTP-binding protein
MSSPNFIDYVKFNARSGHGGAGCLHFHREKFIEKGGPDGGDGGRGGHIILRGNSQMWTLLHLKFRKHVFAEVGKPGEGQNCTGAFGKDIILDVPLGTVARLADSNEILCEIN